VDLFVQTKFHVMEIVHLLELKVALLVAWA